MPRREDVEYEEKLKKGEVDRLIATLEKQKSSAATKLAKRYKELDNLTKELKEKKDALNVEMTKYTEDFFDAEDEIYTRVVDTVSVTMTLAKATERKQTNYEALLEDIYELVPDLTDKIKVLKDNYTKISKIKPKFSVKLKEENMVDRLKNALKSFKNKIMNWGKKYDSELDKIKKASEGLVSDDVTSIDKVDTSNKDSYVSRMVDKSINEALDRFDNYDEFQKGDPKRAAELLKQALDQLQNKLIRALNVAGEFASNALIKEFREDLNIIIRNAIKESNIKISKLRERELKKTKK